MKDLIIEIYKQIDLNNEMIYKMCTKPREKWGTRHDVDFYRGQNKAYRLVLETLEK